LHWLSVSSKTFDELGFHKRGESCRKEMAQPRGNMSPHATRQVSHGALSKPELREKEGRGLGKRGEGGVGKIEERRGLEEGGGSNLWDNWEKNFGFLREPYQTLEIHRGEEFSGEGEGKFEA